MTSNGIKTEVVTINGIPNMLKEKFVSNCNDHGLTRGKGIEAAVDRLPNDAVQVHFEAKPHPPEHWNVRIDRDAMKDIRTRCAGNVSIFLIAAIKSWVGNPDGNPS